MILDEIGRIYGTDKSSDVHDYCRKYEKYLPFNRESKLKILEIGVLEGQSLRMWKEYFYNSEILGIDINPECKKYEEDRITIEIGSQTDVDFLNYTISKYGMFDMIIDDGSHQNSDTIFSFEHLFKYLKTHGVYIIEDTCTSYWPEYGGERYKKGTVIEYFKGIIDEVNFFGEKKETIVDGNIIGLPDRSDKALFEQFMRKKYVYLGIFLESIIFLNSLIIITK